MKVCPNCNAVWEDDVQFCANCGKPIPEAQEPATEPRANGGYQAPPAYQPPAGYYPMQTAEEPVSVWKWVLYHLIPFIPIAGSLIYLVMLFVWGFGSDKNETFRNWAKSQLIMSLIGVVFFILMMIIMVAMGLSFATVMESGSMGTW